MMKPIRGSGWLARSRRAAGGLLIGTCLLLGAACAYRGYDDPASRKLTWFSYLNGDDIRADCMADGPPLFRFVYNAQYWKHLRTYDIRPDPETGTLTMRARVLEEPDLSAFTLSVSDVFSAFEGSTTATTPISAADRVRLESALQESGFFAPAPKGLSMRSDEYYWTGVVCLDGTVTFNAFKWPSERFEALTFPGVLLDLDPTGVAMRQTPDPARYNAAAARLEGDRTRRFSLVVGDNGLRDSGLGL